MKSKRPPTQTDIAKLAGVSQRVVASVVGRTKAGGPRVSESTRQHILEIAKNLGYRPQRQAQLLRGVKSGIIGVVKTISLHQVAIERAYHASLAIQRAGYGQLVQEDIWNNEKSMDQIIEVLLDSRVEGVLLACGLSLKHVTALSEAGIPMVSVGQPQREKIPFVASDHRRAMYDLTRHVLSLGHRAPALETLTSPSNLESPTSWSTRERLAGFYDALEHAGLPPKSGRVIAPCRRQSLFDYSQMGLDFAQMAMEAEEGPPDVLLCQNDLHAIGAQKYLLSKKIDIPGSLAMTGYDNTTLGQYLAVPLTTVAQPAAEIANRAVELLISFIRGENNASSIPEATLLPCELVLRESCGARLPSNEARFAKQSPFQT